jgi:type IV pilus assembly protein PilN
MPKINLLPWREERRNELRKEFYTMLGGCAVIAVVSLFLAHMLYVSRIDYQERKNRYLETEITKLDERIKEIKNLQKERQQLMARVDVIERLQRNRPSVVKMFDDFVKVAPDGLYYLIVTRKDNMVTLEGKAESNTRVSKLMRNIELSTSLSDPRLDEIRAEEGEAKKKGTSDMPNYFNLQAKIASEPAMEKRT